MHDYVRESLKKAIAECNRILRDAEVDKRKFERALAQLSETRAAGKRVPKPAKKRPAKVAAGDVATPMTQEIVLNAMIALGPDEAHQEKAIRKFASYGRSVLPELKRLIAHGDVEQIGQKRGAKYRVTDQIQRDTVTE